MNSSFRIFNSNFVIFPYKKKRKKKKNMKLVVRFDYLYNCYLKCSLLKSSVKWTGFNRLEEKRIEKQSRGEEKKKRKKTLLNPLQKHRTEKRADTCKNTVCLSRQDTEIRVKVQGVAFKEMFLQPAAFKRKLKLLESSRVYSSIFEKKKKQTITARDNKPRLRYVERNARV